ncbi:MAG: flagellar biosynthesis protein FlhB [Pseudorhodoplanes sp.]|jgi:flagellar biosynthetic protein FlhB|nr:flagellar biosynthesis protein FlhB [Pseudorhodoplanes sp.]
MADGNDDNEKSEDPTQKRLDEAVERGDVAKSQEVSTWFVIAAATLLLMMFATPMSAGLKSTLGGILANMHRIPMDGRGLILFAGKTGLEVIALLSIPFLLLALAAIGGNMIQHRLVWSTESLKPKLSKISLAAGLKRLFSKVALVNFVKGILKIALLGTVMSMLLWPERNRLESMVATDPAAILPLVVIFSLKLMGIVVAILAVIAAADFFFQYRQWYEKQKMSLREIKEEFKQSEGDPMVKARIRRIREQRARKRMMAAVPDASVVITNPTHYAIALKYERGDNAPVCVAKGVDALALKIREVATAHAVPIVENPPLARALHATVDIDDEIPPEHYRAVAEVIGYVMNLRRGARPRP